MHIGGNALQARAGHAAQRHVLCSNPGTEDCPDVASGWGTVSVMHLLTWIPLSSVSA